MKRLDGTNGQNGQNGIEALAKLLGDSDGHPRYHGAVISLGVINVLPQPRQTFKGIANLAFGMAQKGQIEPPIVLRLNRDYCMRYLTAINLVWKMGFQLSDVRGVREGGKRWYYILVAGERRYRAFRALWEEGCDECAEKYGREAPGACFRRHFRRRKDIIEVRLCTNEPPLSALFVQHQENIHMAVPPHEEAKAHARLFRVVRQVKEKYTLAQFARDVGRSPDTVRNELRFVDLPSSVQAYIENGAVPYGIGIELTRLHQLGLKARELDWWAMRAITDRKKVPEFHDLVTKYLAERTSSQIDLLGIVEREDEKLLRRLHIRRTVQGHIIQALWGWTDYFKKVLQLFEEGKLGKEDSPFSVRSPIRVFLSLIEVMERVLPHFRGLISRARHTHAREVLDRTKMLAEQVEKVAKSDHSSVH